MVAVSAPRASVVVMRWLFGMALVSWRYMWQITPLHREERPGDQVHDAPPPMFAAQVDDQVQLADEGVGPLYHRCFCVNIPDAEVAAEELMRRIKQDFGRFVPSEVVAVRRSPDADGPLQDGEEFVIEMPGPWNGPVRVVSTTRTCLRLATLRGHMEAGQVQFQARDAGTALEFEIHAWARPSTQLVRWLYCVLRLAKEIQLNMWVRFCRQVVTNSGGRLFDGVWIQTLQLPDHARVQVLT